MTLRAPKDAEWLSTGELLIVQGGADVRAVRPTFLGFAIPGRTDLVESGPDGDRIVSRIFEMGGYRSEEMSDLAWNTSLGGRETGVRSSFTVPGLGTLYEHENSRFASDDGRTGTNHSTFFGYSPWRGSNAGWVQTGYASVGYYSNDWTTQRAGADGGPLNAFGSERAWSAGLVSHGTRTSAFSNDGTEPSVEQSTVAGAGVYGWLQANYKDTIKDGVQNSTYLFMPNHMSFGYNGRTDLETGATDAVLFVHGIIPTGSVRQGAAGLGLSWSPGNDGALPDRVDPFSYGEGALAVSSLVSVIPMPNHRWPGLYTPPSGSTSYPQAGSLFPADVLARGIVTTTGGQDGELAQVPSKVDPDLAGTQLGGAYAAAATETASLEQMPNKTDPDLAGMQLGAP